MQSNGDFVSYKVDVCDLDAKRLTITSGPQLDSRPYHLPLCTTSSIGLIPGQRFGNNQRTDIVEGSGDFQFKPVQTKR